MVGKDGGQVEKEQYEVRVLSGGQEVKVIGHGGTTLMDIFHRNNIHIEAPCGGKGICGKCKVRVSKGEVSPITDLESKFLSNNEKQEGYRLACMTRVLGDVEVLMKNHLEGAQIMSTGLEYSVDLMPRLTKKFITLSKPTVDDQRDDLQRIAQELEVERVESGVHIIRKLPQVLRDSDFKVTIALDGDKILDVEAGDTSHRAYGVAIDIGTTTVVCYLMDLLTGKQLDIISGLNLQRTYGGDVISRIQHTMEDAEGLIRQQRAILNQVSDLIDGLAQRNNIDLNNIYNVVIVGNTIMGHLFMGFDPQHIAAAPFTPVATDSMAYRADELGLKLGIATRVFILPHISGYVGSDVVAGILASGMDKGEDLSLLIDIGTNGEIALGSRDKLVCCSTAAGPAFEGANIRHGMGGVKGAINTIRLDGDGIRYTTIQDKAPLGICGSGIVDALAVLLDAGIVDETGRILDPDEIESEIGLNLVDRLTEVDGTLAFTIVDAQVKGSGEPILITQKDIREIQLAKAAIAAGVKVLINRVGKTIDDIDHLYLAGGFGSYIDKESAARIGLIPMELKDRIVAIGNGAGTGAMLSLLSSKEYERADNIRKTAEYIELSSTLEFQDEYVNSMYFDV